MCQTPILEARRPSEEVYHSLDEWNAYTKYLVLEAKNISIHWIRGSPMLVKTTHILAVLSRDNSPLESHAPWEVDLGSPEK